MESYNIPSSDGIFVPVNGIPYKEFRRSMRALDRSVIQETVFNGEVLSLPLATSAMIHTDDYVKNRYMTGAFYRSIIKSKSFEDLAKDYMKSKLRRIHEKKIDFSVVDSDPKFSPIYDMLFEYDSEVQYHIVKEHLDMKSSDSILEIGSSTGNLITKLAKHVKKAVGIDVSQAYNSYAAEKALGLGLKNCEFVTGEYPADLKDEFDYAVSFSFVPELITGMLPKKLLWGMRFSEEIFTDSWTHERFMDTEVLAKFGKNYEVSERFAHVDKSPDYDVVFDCVVLNRKSV